MNRPTLLRSRRSNFCNRYRWRYLQTERRCETETWSTPPRSTSSPPARVSSAVEPTSLLAGECRVHEIQSAASRAHKFTLDNPKTEAPCAISPRWRTPRRSQGCPAHTSPRRKTPRHPHEARNEWFKSDIQYHIEWAHNKRFQCDLCNYVTKFACILKGCTQGACTLLSLGCTINDVGDYFHIINSLNHEKF